jgi:hypothetical protein
MRIVSPTAELDGELFSFWKKYQISSSASFSDNLATVTSFVFEGHLGVQTVRKMVSSQRFVLRGLVPHESLTLQ